MKTRVNYGEYQQRQDCSKPKPKHNHNGHALEEHIQQQGGEAKHGRKGGEQDGTQARRGGVNDRTVLILLRFLLLYLFTWFYERHFFFALFKADRNAFILTGSQIYILIIALVIAANGVRFRRNAEFKESVLAAISKTMTGVYIMHYSVFHLLTALIPVTSLSTKLALIVLTFVTSVLFSLLILSNAVAKKVITL